MTQPPDSPLVEQVALALDEADERLAALAVRAGRLEGDSDSPLRVAGANEIWREIAAIREQHRKDAAAAVAVLQPLLDERGWRPIESAPESGYIVVAWQDGSRWRFAQVFSEYGEWVDVHSDRIHHPTHWMPLPEPPESKEDAR